jgi:hypothetical protein
MEKPPGLGGSIFGLVMVKKQKTTRKLGGRYWKP